MGTRQLVYLYMTPSQMVVWLFFQGVNSGGTVTAHKRSYMLRAEKTRLVLAPF